MPVTGIGTTSPNPQSTEAAPRSALGKDDFLKLLMAQLGNQDPLSPMDNQEFVAQLAQFANVEALQAQSQRLDALLVAQAGANQMAASNLVGKEATHKAETVTWPGGGGAMHLGGTVASNAATVTVLVKDSTGAVVHTETVNDVAAGPVDIAWTTPLDLPAGKYSVSFVAADAQGHSIPIDATARSLIKGVSFENGYAELLLEDGTRLALANVMQVNLPRS